MDRLAAMEAFVRVIDTGSFSAAAKQLSVGQSALSKMIAQLEERLCARLLLRSTHGLAPTEAGRSFYECAKRLVREAENAELAAHDAATALSGRLRICAAVSFARAHVIPHLPRFLAEHPALNLDMVFDDRHIDLVEAGIDLGLRVGSLSNSTLITRKLGQCQRRVIGTSTYFKAAGMPRIPLDLQKHQVIIHDQPVGGSVWTFRQGAVEATIRVSGRIRTNTASAIRQCVLADLGVAIVSEWMFGAELGAEKVKSVLRDWSLPPVEVWAIFPMGRQASAKARAFVSFIAKQMSDAGAC